MAILLICSKETDTKLNINKEREERTQYFITQA